MRSHIFRVVVERDGKAWHAYCPALVQWGAATWGRTKAEALKHIQEVVEMVIEEMGDQGVPIPRGPAREVSIFPEPRVAVTVG